MKTMVDLKDTLLAGFSRIDQRFDRIEGRFDEHDRQFKIVYHRLGRIETRIESLEQKLTA